MLKKNASPLSIEPFLLEPTGELPRDEGQTITNITAGKITSHKIQFKCTKVCDVSKSLFYLAIGTGARKTRVPPYSKANT